MKYTSQSRLIRRIRTIQTCSSLNKIHTRDTRETIMTAIILSVQHCVANQGPQLILPYFCSYVGEPHHVFRPHYEALYNFYFSRGMYYTNIINWNAFISSSLCISMRVVLWLPMMLTADCCKIKKTSYDPTPYVQRARVTRAAPPKPATNPMQFVQIKPCQLYQSAQEQLKRAEEVKKVKEVKKEEPEDWQSVSVFFSNYFFVFFFSFFLAWCLLQLHSYAITGVVVVMMVTEHRPVWKCIGICRGANYSCAVVDLANIRRT